MVPGILLKPGTGKGPHPALLYFHGKSGINLKGWGGLPNYAFHQYLVQRGYSVLFVNWRGTHVGYGAEFERANYRDYAGGELDDVVAGAQFIAKETGADPKRIACWGGSYGGYMTMLAITKAPEVFSAGISLYGVADWATWLTQNKVRAWRVRALAKLGAPEKNGPLYERAAAIRYAQNARAPLLILQGQDDDGVVPAQGEALYDAMRKADKTVDYVAYIGEGHGFRHTGSQRDLYTRVDSFLLRYNDRRATQTN
jgi:dipeptidyl aminopeptidase/acylaminoacyl peptidase